MNDNAQPSSRNETRPRPALPPDVFAAVRDMWTTILVRDYIARHALDAVDVTSSAVI
jgi:hypothetical protein